MPTAIHLNKKKMAKKEYRNRCFPSFLVSTSHVYICYLMRNSTLFCYHLEPWHFLCCILFSHYIFPFKYHLFSGKIFPILLLFHLKNCQNFVNEDNIKKFRDIILSRFGSIIHGARYTVPKDIQILLTYLTHCLFSNLLLFFYFFLVVNAFCGQRVFIVVFCISEYILYILSFSLCNSFKFLNKRNLKLLKKRIYHPYH